jgi:hypothetical protein
MNQLLEDIFATIVADSATAALVARRVYPDQASQGAALPYIIYQQVSLTGSYNLAGADGTRSVRVQFDAYSADIAECDALANRLLALFDGKKQTLAGRTEVLGCFIEGADSSYEDGERIRRQRLDLMFNYRT